MTTRTALLHPILLVVFVLTLAAAQGQDPTPATAAPAVRPVLPDDVAERVADIDTRIEELSDAFLRGEIESLEEAIELAEEILALRLAHQGPESEAGSAWTDADGHAAEWYEVADDRRTVPDLRRLAALVPHDRAKLASLIGSDDDVERLYAAGRYADAQTITERQLDILSRVLGDEHPRTLTSISNMGALLRSQGRLAEAEPYYREALQGSRRVLGDEHPDTLNSMGNMGFLLKAQGRLAEAEPYYRDALAGRRRVLGDEHPRTLTSISNMGALLRSQGRLAEAEPYLREALELAERLRTAVIGQEQAHAFYAKKIGMSTIATRYASLLPRLDRDAEAFSVVERGRGRALLDLLQRASIDVIEQARQRAGADAASAAALERALVGEVDARAAQATAVARVEALRKERSAQDKRENLTEDERAQALTSYDTQIDAQIELVATRRRATFEAGRRVLGELQGLVPEARPLATDEILAALDDDELVLSFAWSGEHVVAMTASRADGTGAVAIADGKDAVTALKETLARLRDSISTRPQGAQWSAGAARAALDAVVPEALRHQVSRARRVVVLPDGPLNDIPFELLLESDAALAHTAVVYASSATMYVNRRRAAAERRFTGTPTAVVLGDPVFDREAPTEVDYPQDGVLVAMVADGTNAAEGGLVRGDVILSYAGREVVDRAALLAAKSEVTDEVEQGTRDPAERFTVTVWRNGREVRTTLAPGRMGVRLDSRAPVEGLLSMARAARGVDQLHAEASMLDQVRLYGGGLAPLPGTNREAEHIAEVLASAGGSATMLLGEQATIGRLEAAVEGRRYVHLATHGLTGSADRPYDAGLALARPATPAPGDIGFLTLEHLIGSWRGKLSDCDLVVLSACDTQRGVKAGGSVMALPWGFFYAGAPTVIASLWKVDDTATSLLMGRLYENLLGAFDAPRTVGASGRSYAGGKALTKVDALREAKSWLRTLTAPERNRLVATLPRGQRGEFRPRPSGEQGPSAATEQLHPYAHPYFWSAFILIGSPQ